jgi:hypothetical protein
MAYTNHWYIKNMIYFLLTSEQELLNLINRETFPVRVDQDFPAFVVPHSYRWAQSVQKCLEKLGKRDRMAVVQFAQIAWYWFERCLKRGYFRRNAGPTLTLSPCLFGLDQSV